MCVCLFVCVSVILVERYYMLGFVLHLKCHLVTPPSYREKHIPRWG